VVDQSSTILYIIHFGCGLQRMRAQSARKEKYASARENMLQPRGRKPASSRCDKTATKAKVESRMVCDI